jgi:3-oxoacyl-[acyl-carrier protein] reductase
MTRRIVITGGGSGIGLACARRFLAEDASIVLVGRRAEVLETAVAGLRTDADATGSSATVEARAADLRDPAAVGALADDLRSGPSVDVLVLNAGGNFSHAGADDLVGLAAGWQAEFDGNVLTTVLLPAALDGHVTEPGGRIVAMSSVAALRGSGAYGGVKAAVNAWMYSEATRLAPRGITVNAVAPGFVPDTEFWEQRMVDDPNLFAGRVATIPAGRPGTPDEVAAAVQYLASPDAGWTTGQILQVNGGTLLGRG